MVLISESPFKKPLFTAAERKAIVEQTLALHGWHDVRVVVVKGDYTVRAAKRQGIDYLIRGIRNTSDFDYENLIQQANVKVVEGAKTLFVMPRVTWVLCAPPSCVGCKGRSDGTGA